MMERLQVRLPEGAKGEFSFQELTFCADSYSESVPSHVTVVARKRPQSFFKKCKWEVKDKYAYTLDPTKSEWADNAVQE